jgi:peptidoglycan/LPS O-acetylase OafA/YrhL
MQSPHKTQERMPALDGLRALAVIAVLVFHFKSQALLPGGSYGVDVFFVLSGFLITGLLYHEWHSTGTISLSRFYARRVLRLMPAAVAFMAINVGLILLLRDDVFPRQVPTVHETWVNLGYFASYLWSWAFAFNADMPENMRHMWSLSIEEQFYLLWPGLLFVLFRLHVRLPVIVGLTVIAAVASASLPYVLGMPEGSLLTQPLGSPDMLRWKRLYYGADYRAHALLIGCVAGLLFSSGTVRLEHVKSVPFRLLLLAATGYVFYALFTTHIAEDRYIFEYGFAAVALASAVIVVAAAFVTRGVWNLLLGNPAIRWVGRRSYAIYLWHWAFAFFLIDLPKTEHVVVCTAATLLAAEVSYWLVERPALNLRHRLGRRPPRQPIEAPEQIEPSLSPVPAQAGVS